MNSENNNKTKDKIMDKKDDLTNNDSAGKENSKKDTPTEEKINEKENMKKENYIYNNNTLNIDEDKDEKKEKEEKAKNEEVKIEEKNEDKPQKKDPRRRVPIRDWACRSLKEYKIINNPVGKGAYGLVFKANYIGSEEYGKKYGIPKVVALKKINTEKENEGFPITALREIMTMKRLNLDNKNILKLLEVVTSDPIETKKIEEGKINRDVYLVFEYMEHDLCGIIYKNIKYELSQIKFIFHEIVCGLKYLHDNNILHRDLKPANILVNKKNEIKIGDFGLARLFSKTQNIKRYTNQVATLCYRAPELFLGEENYSTEIDIWSLGCILMELLTGRIFFPVKKVERDEREKEVFLLICKTCGTPDEINWPGITNYKNYSKIMPKIKYENQLIKANFPGIDETTLDLIKRILTLNPKKRITMEEILNHPYFTTHEPKMCKQEELPRVEEEMHYYQLRVEMDQKNQENKEQQIGQKDYDLKKEKSFVGKKRKK